MTLKPELRPCSCRVLRLDSTLRATLRPFLTDRRCRQQEKPQPKPRLRSANTSTKPRRVRRVPVLHTQGVSRLLLSQEPGVRPLRETHGGRPGSNKWSRTNWFGWSSLPRGSGGPILEPCQSERLLPERLS